MVVVWEMLHGQVVKVKVTGRTEDDGSERNPDFTCAWITLYRRQGDRWMRLGEVSRFKRDQ